MNVETNKAKSKKKVTLGIAHIKATFNNTIVTFTDVFGNKIAGNSSGKEGFKGAKKATPYAAQLVAKNAAELAKEKGMKTISVNVSGPGGGRESAMRALITFEDFVVTHVQDVSPVAHNGCRPPKRRRN